MKNIDYKIKLLALIGLLAIALGSTYGIFTTYKEGREEQVLTTANLVIVLDDDNSLSISEEEAVPVLDKIATTKVPYHFALKNTGNVDVSYKIKISDDQAAITTCSCLNNQLDKKDIKYRLEKDGILVKTGLLSELENLILDSGSIKQTNIYNYQLWLWISQDATVEAMGKHYHGKLKAEISQIIE